MVEGSGSLEDSQCLRYIQTHLNHKMKFLRLFINLKSLKLDSFLLLRNITDFPDSIQNMFIIESSRLNFMINYPNPTTDRHKIVAGIVKACHSPKDKKAKAHLDAIIPLLESFSLQDQDSIRRDILSILQESCSIQTRGML